MDASAWESRDCEGQKGHGLLVSGRINGKPVSMYARHNQPAEMVLARRLAERVDKPPLDSATR